jgi:hypothetical protein
MVRFSPLLRFTFERALRSSRDVSRLCERERYLPANLREASRRHRRTRYGDALS